jgi:hypothetical protein
MEGCSVRIQTQIKGWPSQALAFRRKPHTVHASKAVFFGADTPERPPENPKGFWKRVGETAEHVFFPILMLNSGYRLNHYASHDKPSKREKALEMALSLNSNQLIKGKRQLTVLEKLSVDPDEALRLKVLKALPDLAIDDSSKVDLISRQLSLPENLHAKSWVLQQLQKQVQKKDSVLSSLPKMAEITLSLLRQDASPEARSMVLRMAETLPMSSEELDKTLMMASDSDIRVQNAFLGFVKARVVTMRDVPTDKANAYLDLWAESDQMSRRLAVIHKLFVWPMTDTRRLALISKMEDNSREEVKKLLVMAASMLPNDLGFDKLWRASLNLNYNIRRQAAVQLVNLSDESKKLKLIELAARDPQACVREAAIRSARVAFENPENTQKALAMFTVSDKA